MDPDYRVISTLQCIGHLHFSMLGPNELVMPLSTQNSQNTSATRLNEVLLTMNYSIDEPAVQVRVVSFYDPEIVFRVFY